MDNLSSQLLIETYQQTKSTYETARLLGVHRSKVYRDLVKLGVDMIGKSGPKTKLGLFSGYFNTIDSEDKAYWLGFIAADGCIRINKSGAAELSLHLSQKDQSHLEVFRSTISAESAITTRINGPHTSVRLRIIRKEMTDALQTHGILPNKTTIGVLLPALDPMLLRHWVRGYVDGDGSFWIRKRNQSLCFGVVASTPTLISQFRLLFAAQKIHGGSISQTAVNCWRLTYEGQKAKQIGNYLYTDSAVSLKRKRSLALSENNPNTLYKALDDTLRGIES